MNTITKEKIKIDIDTIKNIRESLKYGLQISFYFDTAREKIISHTDNIGFYLQADYLIPLSKIEPRYDWDRVKRKRDLVEELKNEAIYALEDRNR